MTRPDDPILKAATEVSVPGNYPPHANHSKRPNPLSLSSNLDASVTLAILGGISPGTPNSSRMTTFQPPPLICYLYRNELLEEAHHIDTTRPAHSFQLGLERN